MKRNKLCVCNPISSSLLQSLKLNSSENTKLVIMASTIGIPPAPVLKALSENFTVVSIFI